MSNKLSNKNCNSHISYLELQFHSTNHSSAVGDHFLWAVAVCFKSSYIEMRAHDSDMVYLLGMQMVPGLIPGIST